MQGKDASRSSFHPDSDPRTEGNKENIEPRDTRRLTPLRSLRFLLFKVGELPRWLVLLPANQYSYDHYGGVSKVIEAFITTT